MPSSGAKHHNDLPPTTLEFYRNVLNTLNSASVPYLVGGAYAFSYYTKINRHTKDFDIFIDRVDYERIADLLRNCGYEVELTYPHWLAKAYSRGDFIDLVFSSGNGVAEVDQAWMDNAVSAKIFGVETRMCPVEEMIWSKAFIMERERFDGADIAHLILACGRELQWPRLLQRFDPHWRLLLSHLVLFGFIYPSHREVIPQWVMDELFERFRKEKSSASSKEKLCGGTLLSREQYLEDICRRRYRDARLAPHGKMTEQETRNWTEAIGRKD